ncbi:MAG: signal transduction histidine kinase with CheB and CheR, partial [Polaromonas sp.]|nr:signal transduction histidine kinase with CheB and CheR [Polaromonas sp.]
QRFFEQMPERSGMAFVIILHLSPEHESNAAQILQRSTRMPVMQVVERTPIEPDHVYVIPPSRALAMDDGHLALSEPSRTGGVPVAIDLFFRTLAQVHQERSVAIVMSGTGADGAVGLARVKENGGVTLAQSPGDAEYDGMPKAAIGTGMVDFVATAAELPHQLVDLWANARRITMPREGDQAMKVVPPEGVKASQLAEEALRDIMGLLRSYSKNDFKHYKRATVLRRIERRLQVRGMRDLPSYRDFLREHPDEAKPLLQDMLISVTNFFRDRDAFDALEREVLPALFDGRPAEEAIRVWVAACATGEEAYSVGMLLRERADAVSHGPDFQVFATDIDERAVGVARTALYPESIMADVAPAHLRQYFQKEQDHFRVVKGVREKVLFAHHNLLRDPPFSRLDLICCRNLLIYLDREAQASILEMFRFALKPGGYLFLGTSESADAAPTLFTVVDKKNRIYRTNPRTQALRHLPLQADLGIGRQVLPFAKEVRREFQQPPFAELHQRCLGELVSPSVLIDAKHNVLHLSEHVGKFMQHGSGAPSLNLLSNVQQELRTELRTALFQAGQVLRPVQTRAVGIARGKAQVFVQMTVRSFGDEGELAGLAVVMFDEVDARQRLPHGETDPSHARVIDQLEFEIRQLKEQLRDTVEQSETSNEELKASNEELQAINEELRSATEELETSKEELQSINEELITVNFELKVKVDETGKINDDLQNLIASSDIATVFIDRAMRIKRFTPQATSVFNLISTDINRPLLDITHKLDYEALATDVAEVLKSLNTTERQVRNAEGRHYLVRIRPYRTTDDRIDGAVLTFVDVTALRQAEQEVRAGEERLRIAAETTRDYAIITVDGEGMIDSWNVGAQRMFGYDEKEIVGRHIEVIFTPEDRAAGAPALELKGAREHGRSEDERWHMRKDGSTFYCSGVMTPLEGDTQGFAKIARDMTENKRLQSSRDEMLLREQAANDLKDEFLAVMSHELKHPLNLIQVNAELLISQPEVRALPAVARAGQTIQRAVASQTKIIDDLLDLSRARTGKLTLHVEAVELNELASVIATATHDAVKAKGLTLALEVAPEPLVALCDRVRTEQIFWNLINNAIKFTPAGGTITVTLQGQTGFAIFSVKDTGQGIAADFLPRVFDMFVQAPQQAFLQNTGLGVGLAMVRDLAEAQGGRVFAESAGPGLGASFSVWLPLKANGQVVAESPPEVRALQGLRMLVVDDMVDSLEPFAELLRLDGHEVDTANDAAAALRLLETRAYDLMISDLGMDGMDGFGLIAEVRRRPGLEHLMAIALSGYGRAADVKRALAS